MGGSFGPRLASSKARDGICVVIGSCDLGHGEREGDERAAEHDAGVVPRLARGERVLCISKLQLLFSSLARLLMRLHFANVVAGSLIWTCTHAHDHERYDETLVLRPFPDGKVLSRFSFTTASVDPGWQGYHDGSSTATSVFMMELHCIAWL